MVMCLYRFVRLPRAQSASGRRSCASAGALLRCGLAAVALSGAAAHADIYGFVDEKGVAHLASQPLDPRYILFKKEVLPPEGYAADDSAPRNAFDRVRVSAAQRRHYAPLVAAVAREHSIEPALLHAVITVESGYDPKARSPKGAMGLMQLMPDTARRYAVTNVWDPRENLRGGARYLRDLLALFGDNLTLALAAYNAGEAAVAKYGNRIPPYPETLSYVPRVMKQYHALSRTTNRITGPFIAR